MLMRRLKKKCGELKETENELKGLKKSTPLSESAGPRRRVWIYGKCAILAVLYFIFFTVVASMISRKLPCTKLKEPVHYRLLATQSPNVKESPSEKKKKT
ncbi:hypothetical protein BT93_L3738 [Corymbia citriodora subsp. variegata]|uniref:Uncharacterized protein n=1 Tax=Corymbia citriodora subsp. variegata TaxID=360336 RepID=A0A8T0CV99_CORYI|nr:hypothetical protein BT93_L3738 [Corymbia citriodora subsp. variegata]